MRRDFLVRQGLVQSEGTRKGALVSKSKIYDEVFCRWVGGGRRMSGLICGECYFIKRAAWSGGGD